MNPGGHSLSRPAVLDVWKLAMPPGTRLVAGRGGLWRGVTWAVTPSTRYPAFAALQGGELALFPLAHLGAIGEHLTPRRLVERMAGAGIVAMAFDGNPGAEAIAFADANDIPLFVLPPHAHLHKVERDVIRLLVNREAQIVRQGQVIYTQLMQLATGDEGLSAIVQSLCEMTDRPVALYDREGERGFEAHPAGCKGKPAPPLVLPSAGALDLPPGEAVYVPGADGSGGYICAVHVDGKPWGYLYVGSQDGSSGELERIAAVQGALACAVEISKAQRVAEAENRLRGSFLDALLAPMPPDISAYRSELAGYELDGEQIAFAWGASGDAPQVHTGLREVERALVEMRVSGRALIWHRREAEVIALHAPRGRLRPAQAGSLAEEVRQKAVRLCPGLFIGAGVGEPGKGMAGARTSLRQALQALQIGRETMRVGGTLLFRELGIYRLLAGLRGSDELRRFYRETLAPLVNYDAESKGELVKTLAAFLAHNGNVTRTAQALHLHRSSLLYRLERIAEIGGLDLNDPEVRLQLHLALKVMPLVEARPPTL